MTGAGARGIAGVVAATLCATACAPAVLWSRRTSDRSVGLEVRSEGQQRWLVATDRKGVQRESARFDEIAFDQALLSDRGRHFAVAARRGQRWHVLHDLAEGPAWDGVATLTLSASGEHLAYGAQQGERWRVVIDGVPGPAHDGIAEPFGFSDDGARAGYVALDRTRGCARAMLGGSAGPCWRGIKRLALGCGPGQDSYVAVDGDRQVIVRAGAVVGRFDEVTELAAADCGRRWAAVVRVGARWQAIVDGQVGPEAEQIAQLSFAPAGHHVAFAAKCEGWRMVVDGVEGPRFDAVGAPSFSADGTHVGYLGERAGGKFLLLDGAERPVAPSALGLALAPDGRRFAYVAGNAAHPAVVCDGVAYLFPMVVEDTVTFSRDGRHWGVLAGNLAQRKLFVAVDGRAARGFDTVELFGSASAAPTFLRRWVAAEMELALAEVSAP